MQSTEAYQHINQKIFGIYPPVITEVKQRPQVTVNGVCSTYSLIEKITKLNEQAGDTLQNLITQTKSWLVPVLTNGGFIISGKRSRYEIGLKGQSWNSGAYEKLETEGFMGQPYWKLKETGLCIPKLEGYYKSTVVSLCAPGLISRIGWVLKDNGRPYGLLSVKNGTGNSVTQAPVIELVQGIANTFSIPNADPLSKVTSTRAIAQSIVSDIAMDGAGLILLKKPTGSISSAPLNGGLS